MLILVTGGAGFIGSHVVRHLREGGHEVRVLDLCIHGPGQDGPDVIKKDVRDAAAVRAAARGCEYIVHLASIAGVSSVGANPVRTMDVIFNGTRNVLEAAAKTGAGVLCFSSSEVNGTHVAATHEDEPTALPAPENTRWGYGAAKLASEHLALAYAEHLGVDAVSFRIFNTYGPHQLGDGAVHNFVRAALRGKPLRICGDGSAVRTWCYVSDTVRAVEAVIRERRMLAISGHQVFNIGNPHTPVTTRELARMVSRAAKAGAHVVEHLPGGTDVRVRIPNISKAQDILGWNPRVPLEHGLQATVEAYRELNLSPGLQ